ncbi:MAG TPA: DNA polymerase IV [Acidimicrobiia bacterium]|nr:DNA polymerase IV [Acidimicrobiia bacterium]
MRNAVGGGDRRPGTVREVWDEPILHVDMDAFFVAVERRRDPSLRGRPVVVGGAGPRSVVAAASYEVRRYGIRSAMPMSRARSLCPDLVIVPPDHAEYGRVSEEVFAVFRSFTPLVEGLSIDEAFLDVGGLRRHYRGPVEVGEEIRRAVREDVGLTASVGVAATKFVAKLASEHAKPDGLRHVPRASQQAFLDALPIEALWGVGQATRAALEGVGAETVSDLREIPLRVLERAVGAAVAAHLVELAHGRDPRSVEPDRETKSMSVEETFERDIVGVDRLAGELRRLADRLGSRLRRAGLAGRTITLKVRTAEFRTVTRSITHPHATDSTRVIFTAARELLDGMDERVRPVRLLGIGVSQLSEPGSAIQLGTGSRWEEVESAVDAIRARFGDDSVLSTGLGPPAGEQVPDESRPVR